MTRPPAGVSFAQFFPNAPRVRAEAQAQSQGRADRERSRRSIAPSSSSREASAATATSAAAAPATALNADAKSSLARPSLDAPHSHLDDNESLPGEIPSTVGSASSHASSASSVFGSSMRTSATAPPSQLSTTATPRASRESRSRSPAAASRPDMPAYLASDLSRQARRDALPADNSGSTSDKPSLAERVPARDPLPSVKGLKCTNSVWYV
ncbi:hypothetical protein CDD83_1869 [Cordyceps sp. RAO-2017]|nr:hypothetical protein CDD83_1869 [Cordyceps sp. RAO-2017]